MHKYELGKETNKTSEKTHQKKIVNIHMKHGVEQVNKCEKMKVNSFRIDNDWFNDGGSEYTRNERL